MFSPFKPIFPSPFPHPQIFILFRGFIFLRFRINRILSFIKVDLTISCFLFHRIFSYFEHILSCETFFHINEDIYPGERSGLKEKERKVKIEKLSFLWGGEKFSWKKWKSFNCRFLSFRILFSSYDRSLTIFVLFCVSRWVFLFVLCWRKLVGSSRNMIELWEKLRKFNSLK